MIKRKLFFKWLLGTLIVLGFVSCGKPQNASTEDTLDRIRRTGVIEACVVPEPPFVIKDAKTGALSGIDVDTLNLIAQKMNAKVNWRETGINNFIADVQSGRCDVLSQSSLFAIIPRAMALAFTQPRIYVGLTAIIRKNDLRFKNYKNIMDFDKPNITVIANRKEVPRAPASRRRTIQVAMRLSSGRTTPQMKRIMLA